jgi:protein-S-isoprenylcysteine O-methyltransferase Ste14
MLAAKKWNKGQRSMTFIKTLLFLIFIPGSVFILAPYKIGRGRIGRFRFRLGGWRYLAFSSWAAGSALLLWSFWNFINLGRGTPHPSDPPKELVVDGPYRFTRNPQYAGGMLFLLGNFLWSGASALLVYNTVVFAAFHSFILFYEEPILHNRFGESYRHYRLETPRWF